MHTLNSKNSTTPASYTFKTGPVNTAAGTRYYWSFGDNTISDSPAPKHTYSKEGSYLVQVIVQSVVENVCQKTTSFTLLSQYRWTTTLNGQNNFTVSAPVEGVQYEWNFGDGKVMSGTSVNYNFQKDGVYDVILKLVIL